MFMMKMDITLMKNGDLINVGDFSKNFTQKYEICSLF